MINDGTASASELVAGALQDHDRALIVGQPSFGKSLLMRGFPLADGSLVMLVIGHVKTPCGRVIQRQYHTITTRAYYRMARAERDTVGRPSCKTSGGRVVYGGGGIFPDVVLTNEEMSPAWLARAGELSLPTIWAGGYVTANAATLQTLDAFLTGLPLGENVLADFRRLAQAQGAPIPSDASSDAVLKRTLARAIAYAKWGSVGAYSVETVLDPSVAAAVRSFAQAEGVLRAGR